MKTLKFINLKKIKPKKLLAENRIKPKNEKLSRLKRNINQNLFIKK